MMTDHTSSLSPTSPDQAERLARLAKRQGRSGTSSGTASSGGPEGRPMTPGGPEGRPMKWWMRWAHVYVSMISLFVVLFFGITGITLNHQDWTFGTEPVSTTTTGVLPPNVVSAETTDFLGTSEYLRSDYDVKGEVVDYREDGTDGTISYAGPGYRAEVIFSLSDGSFELTEQNQGWITVLNDLHKGRDTKASWRWLIDVSGGLLVVVSVTGLAIQLYMRKRRTRAIIAMVVGTIITLVLLWVAVT